MQRPLISLTTKIVLLVACVGVAFGLINAYATWHMQRMESQYHDLLHLQANTANQIDLVRQNLGSAADVVHSMVRPATADHAQHAQDVLTQLQQAFDAHIDGLRMVLPQQQLQLDAIAMHGKHMFLAGQNVIKAGQAQPNDWTLQTLFQSFVPALHALNSELNTLRENTLHGFETSSHALGAQTYQNIRTTLLTGWASVIVIAVLAAWLAWRFLALPIERLTGSMRRMRLHHYDAPIDYQTRRDEIGSMARALQQFGAALQEAQLLERELALHQKNQLTIEQLQQLTSALPGAVFQMELPPNAQLKLIFVSPQWTALMGLPAGSAHDIATAAATIRYHDAQVTAVSEKHFAQSARTLEPVDFETCLTMLDGTTRWIKTRANPHRQPNGTVIFNGVWLDVTKENQQSQALKKAKAQAEQDAQARSILQASISHEIRTPLNAILGLTQLVLKADLPPPQREQLNNVLRASQHLRGIVNEVLDFSKIDAGQLKLESTDFNLQNLTQDVVRMCQEEANKKGLSLKCTVAPEVPNHLRGDPHRIAQILLNYVNNAIKFTAAGHIQITLQLAPNSTLHRIVLRASVTDTGVGIPADRIPLLFEAYQQADNSITRRFGGTGLGLTISRALAQLMGGTVGVESVLGQGSTFWFTALLEPARTVVPASHEPAAATSALPSNDWQGLRVLVVDDNFLNRAVAQGMLQAMGLESEVAEDGAQALHKLQAVGPHYYCCVLMDIQMPHMDGISATQALRQLEGFAKLPIIAMTAHSGLQDLERTQAAGMNAHLSKPLLESALRAVLEPWIHRPHDFAPPEKGSVVTAPPEPDLPARFDASAIDAMGQLFPASKLQQLIAQFCQDSLQRAHALPTLTQVQDWQAMRAEAHKLAGTAATFGLLQLGHCAKALSAALKQEDALRIHELVEQIVSAADHGTEQLQAYAATLMGHA